MRIYVASSWRNEARQQEAVAALRDDGHAVYDFRHPTADNAGFSWRQTCGEDRTALTDPRRFRDAVLTHPIAIQGFALDMAALATADATVLVLPCGRSAHLELGYAVGQRQRTVVWLPDPVDEPELMYKMCTTIAVSLDEVRQACSSLPTL